MCVTVDSVEWWRFASKKCQFQLNSSLKFHIYSSANTHIHIENWLQLFIESYEVIVGFPYSARLLNSYLKAH